METATAEDRKPRCPERKVFLLAALDKAGGGSATEKRAPHKLGSKSSKAKRTPKRPDHSSRTSSRNATESLVQEKKQPGYRKSAAEAGIFLWLAAILMVLLVVSVRVRLLEVPLERDEGEYAYTGQLMLQGIAPFRLASNMKLPGTGMVYALIMAALGESTTGIHLGFLIFSLGAVVLVFLLGKHLFNIAAGVAAGACYAITSAGLGVMGTAAHATHFVVVFALAGTWFLLQWYQSHRMTTLFWSGLLFGTAFLMKQPGLFFGAFATLYLIFIPWSEWRQRWHLVLLRLAVFLFAAALPFGVTCFVLWRADVFDRFWFWTFTYARAYGTILPISVGWQAFLQTAPAVANPNLGIWLLAAIGLALLWWNKEQRANAVFLTAFLVFSFLAVCPGFYFRQHYFVLLLPAVALLAGSFLVMAHRFLPDGLVVGIFSAAMLFSVLQQTDYLFRLDPIQVSRQLYGANPFPEAVKVAAYIREHSNTDARIAVLGSEPEIFFYSQRQSASSHIYTYALMEPQPYALQMQNELIADLEAVQPEFVVMVTTPASWVVRDTSPTRIFDWWNQYGSQHYALTGVVDIRSSDQTVYKWDAEAIGYQQQSENVIYVYRKQSA